MLDTEMLIGAKFVAGTGEPYPVLNARTGETIAQVPEASAAQVEAAVAAADKAFRTWSRTTPAGARVFSSSSPTRSTRMPMALPPSSP